MDPSIRSLAGSALFSALVLQGGLAMAADEPKPAVETGFTGRWALSETRWRITVPERITESPRRARPFRTGSAGTCARAPAAATRAGR